MSKEISKQKSLTNGEQMLINLGYEIIENTSKYKYFRKNVAGDYAVIKIKKNSIEKYLYIRWGAWYERTDFSFDEILACAEIVKELRDG